jgi:hypothetical protein
MRARATQPEDDSPTIAPPSRVEFNAVLIEIARLRDEIAALRIWAQRIAKGQQKP